MTITLNGTTGITDVNGTAAAPAITGTDTDSGMYFGTNIVALATGGTAAVTVDSSQNVGIGTTSPAFPLDVGGPTANIRVAPSTATNNALTRYVNTGGTGYVGLDNSAGGLTSAYALNLYHTGAYPIVFSTSGTERARIDSSGNSIFGKTTTAIGTVGAYIGSAGRVIISNATTTSADDGLQIYSTGAAAYRFFVSMNGSINATSTSITAISDISLKENIRDLETGLTQILALQPRRFDWKEETQLGEKNVAGFIAQEVEQVLPELVYDYKYSDTETKKSIKMGDILPTLVKAIQEQQALITSLTDRIAALEAR